ncbi:MAG TPA: hypothetical protein H9902_13565 [Candidatus Stackebrandtia faecavium]|nr:hypothetical protein [Candidatus Stackebrandtia faecavium]
MSGSPVLPLRPMTIGELLDAATGLLRSRWQVLLGMSLTLAFLEQIVMTALRVLTIDAVLPQYQGEIIGDMSLTWMWIVVALTSELFIISLLSAVATRTAGESLAGKDPAQLPVSTLTSRQWRFGVSAALVLAVLGGIAAMLCFLPWFIVFFLFGLVIPVMITESPDPLRAFGRSLRLAKSSMGRTGYVRLLSYCTWLLVRGAITLGAIMLVQSNIIDFSSFLFDNFLILLGLAYLVVNTAAYAMMACVDAAIYFEARVRTEGLDIAVSRMQARNEPINLAAAETR